MSTLLASTIDDLVAMRGDEVVDLLRTLAPIPAPSHGEQARTEFCRDWFVSHGIGEVHVDQVGNVICELGPKGGDDLAVFAAHLDVVQPDTEPYPFREEGGRMYAPGVGDDTACLAALMVATRCLAAHEQGLTRGVVVVCNVCEEGLGNLDGTKALMAAYEHRVASFVSFDCNVPEVCVRAVGSHRWRIDVACEGGHSWRHYGRPNAIERLCALVGDLMAMDVPAQGRTTLNVGTIEGGTTVNSIPQHASALFEYRSDLQDNLATMCEQTKALVARHLSDGVDITCTCLGVRPGNSQQAPEAQGLLRDACVKAVERRCGCEASIAASSTDANVPLSMGIPAATVGTIVGGGAHTREEWVDVATLPRALALTLDVMTAVIDLP